MTRSPQAVRRDPRIDRTIRSLREALVDLVAERGFDAITVTDLVERAGLHRATFYRHYNDKDDLLRLWGLEIYALLEREAAAVPALAVASTCSKIAVTSGGISVDATASAGTAAASRSSSA